ncbi:hypothetical protein OCU04_002223 [Sclerotinia nivalis]|uniref:Uncharacterized protein n=1 Tax=Sclerotinia nivalis TaxID=352851 RepID=A0A9X0B084_9HELO|nr:hypothetical protein OCU04_002223 [Sclerotinia nivalis]
MVKQQRKMNNMNRFEYGSAIYGGPMEKCDNKNKGEDVHLRDANSMITIENNLPLNSSSTLGHPAQNEHEVVQPRHNNCHTRMPLGKHKTIMNSPHMNAFLVIIREMVEQCKEGSYKNNDLPNMDEVLLQMPGKKFIKVKSDANK